MGTYARLRQLRQGRSFSAAVVRREPTCSASGLTQVVMSSSQITLMSEYKVLQPFVQPRGPPRTHPNVKV